MTIDQLAAHNHAERLRVLDGAIADVYRCIEIKTERHAVSVANQQANLERLKAEREALLTAAACPAPAFALRDLRAGENRCARCIAAEEILQLRHDIDDHALAIKLLQGIRPDLDELAAEGAISDMLWHAEQVALLTNGDYSTWLAAVDRYIHAVHGFATGRLR